MTEIDLQMTAYHQALTDQEAREALKARKREAKALAALIRMRTARARLIAAKERRERLADAATRADNALNRADYRYGVTFDQYERAVDRGYARQIVAVFLPAGDAEPI